MGDKRMCSMFPAKYSAMEEEMLVMHLRKLWWLKSIICPENKTMPVSFLALKCFQRFPMLMRIIRQSQVEGLALQ